MMAIKSKRVRTHEEKYNTRGDVANKNATDTLIVWADMNVKNMALSFQEADGCAVLW
jgi:hypothetical protein